VCELGIFLVGHSLADLAGLALACRVEQVIASAEPCIRETFSARGTPLALRAAHEWAAPSGGHAVLRYAP
jgi:hypothetical protein